MPRCTCLRFLRDSGRIHLLRQAGGAAESRSPLSRFARDESGTLIVWNLFMIMGILLSVGVGMST